MGNFVKLTTKNEDGSYTRTWLEQDSIKQLSQTSAQGGDNAGTCVFLDDTTVDLCAFNETLDTLK